MLRYLLWKKKKVLPQNQLYPTNAKEIPLSFGKPPFMVVRAVMVSGGKMGSSEISNEKTDLLCCMHII